jgi:hypothetical protein
VPKKRPPPSALGFLLAPSPSSRPIAMTAIRAGRERPPPNSEMRNPGVRMPGLASDALSVKTGDEDGTPRSAARQAAEAAWEAPGRKQASRECHANRPPGRNRDDPHIARARRLLADDVSLERAWHELNRRDRAAASTVEALMFSLRSGVAALGNSSTLGRLSELSEEQARAAAVRLQKFKPEIAPPWTPDDVAVLLAAWGRCHGR